MDQKPSVGRIVHYVIGVPIASNPFKPTTPSVRPAIVVKLNDEGTVNLSIFTDASDAVQFNDPALFMPVICRSYVPHDPEKRSGTWHWPPRT